MPMLNNKAKKQKGSKKINGEAGFTMIEVIVSILVLTIALFGAAASITFALEFSAISKNVSNGKLLIVSSIEEIESLRNSRRLEYKQIENVGNVDNTNVSASFLGFSTGFKPVSLNPGSDAVFGTDDDPTDDSSIRQGYTRQITITKLAGSDTIKKVEIIVRYEGVANKIGEISGVAYLNNEERITR